VLSDLSIPIKMMVRKTIASIGKVRAEPIDANLSNGITPWPGTSAFVDLHA
jgi:hypothetical protein